MGRDYRINITVTAAESHLLNDIVVALEDTVARFDDWSYPSDTHEWLEGEAIVTLRDDPEDLVDRCYRIVKAANNGLDCFVAIVASPLDTGTLHTRGHVVEKEPGLYRIEHLWEDGEWHESEPDAPPYGSWQEAHDELQDHVAAGQEACRDGDVQDFNSSHWRIAKVPSGVFETTGEAAREQDIE